MAPSHIPVRRDLTPRASIAEANSEHRRQVRNLLAVIRAIVHRTAASATSVECYVAHLAGRLDVLARIQEILLRVPGARVDLAEILADEFMAQGIAPHNVEMSGKSLWVDGSVAAVLALAVHELATNAIKFGPPEELRRICVRWHQDPERADWTVLEWTEHFIDSLEQEPGAVIAGFGFELIRQTLPYEIGARTCVEITAGTLKCEIRFSPAAMAGRG